MKKSTFTCLLVMVIISVLAQDKLTVLPKVEFAYMPGGHNLTFMESKFMTDSDRNVATYLVQHDIRMGEFRFRTGTDIKYKGFTFNADAMVYCDKSEKDVSFAPKSATWNASLAYNITSMIKIRVEHSCTHPISCNGYSTANLYDGHNMIAISYGY